MIRRAGTLREVLEFQEPTDTPDGKGGINRTWSTVETRRGRKEHKGTKLFHAVSQRYMQVQEVFHIREFDVNPDWRLVVGSNIYRIVGVELADRETIIAVENDSTKDQVTRNYGH